MSHTIPKPSTLNAKPRIQSPSDINLQIPTLYCKFYSQGFLSQGILKSRTPLPSKTPQLLQRGERAYPPVAAGVMAWQGKQSDK